MISGALDPRAMSVRLATVAFHTVTVISTVLPPRSVRRTFLSAEVITSMAAMKMSEIMATPKKAHASVRP
jgi:hypothetical protein